MRIIPVIHGLILVAWVAIVAVLALGIATLGNEEAMLSRERGAQLEARRDLAHQRDRLRAALQWEARREELEVAVRRLDLPLEAPGSVPISGDVELAVSDGGGGEGR